MAEVPSGCGSAAARLHFVLPVDAPPAEALHEAGIIKALPGSESAHVVAGQEQLQRRLLSDDLEHSLARRRSVDELRNAGIIQDNVGELAARADQLKKQRLSDQLKQGSTARLARPAARDGLLPRPVRAREGSSDWRLRKCLWCGTANGARWVRPVARRRAGLPGRRGRLWRRRGA